jgi:hypothetical protein
VKSNALTRCCKDLGIGSECWDRSWCEDWRDKHAVHVYVAEKSRDRDSRGSMVTKDYWRRTSAHPFHGELEPVKDSPNQAAWRKQMEGVIKILEAEIKASKEVAEKLRNLRGQARASTSEADKVTKETARAVEQVQSSERRQEPQAAPQQKRAEDPQDRKYLIRACTILKRTAEYVFHKITMKDGAEFFTYSTTIYAAFQMMFARGDQVEIFSWETKKVGNVTYRHIKEYRVLRSGAVGIPREPGAEG